ncbi:MAG: hypothetical protein ACKPKO_33855, partial [Candidatus Fonsibacter sp.]
MSVNTAPNVAVHRRFLFFLFFGAGVVPLLIAQQSFGILGIQQDGGLPVGVASPRPPSGTLTGPSSASDAWWCTLLMTNFIDCGVTWALYTARAQGTTAVGTFGAPSATVEDEA